MGYSDNGPTLSDVAQLAGVSLATASKALNDRPDVSLATRRRVREAADMLSFSPNQAARSLTAGRTGTVGLLTSDLEGRFVLPILMGAEDALGAGQINVFLCDARGDAIREEHHLKALLSRRVDGIVVVGSTTDPRPSLGAGIPVPVVYAYAPSEDPADISFVPDNVSAGRLAAEHLLVRGRRRIAHITGDPAYAAARDRVRGVDEALLASGLSPVADAMYAEWSEHWGRDAATVLLARHPDIDGIVCGSDQIARGVIDGLRDAGRRIPDDIALVSFDNWEVLAVNARPQLTSVDFKLQRLGRLAARAVFDAIDGKPVAHGVHAIPGRLVARGSSIAG